MQGFPTRIPTERLALSDVPGESSPWVDIGRFALTFDPAEKDPYRLGASADSEVTDVASLVELRARLFFEQRRWNHFGRPPDEAAMVTIRRIVALIRLKL